MKRLTPRIIAQITKGRYYGSDDAMDSCIKGAVRDSHDVTPGSLFVCINGLRTDGHSFANDAFAAGAACCLVERHIPDAEGPYVHVKSTLESIKAIGGYYRRQFTIPIIGITGSVGKTTVRELIAAVLGARYRVHKTYKNLNNELGVPLTLLSLEEGHEAAVIEMGISDFGEMGRLAEMVLPDILVMTKIGYSHITELGDLDGVLRAKCEVFDYMKPDGIAILNGDDDLLYEYDPGLCKLTFGLRPYNDYHAENIRAEGTNAVTCDIVSESARYPVRIPAYGNHLAQLAPAAVAVARSLNMEEDEICRGFLSFTPVNGRANVGSTGAITIIDDCYNANPHSMAAALASLSQLAGRRVAILGDMLNLGPQSDNQHRELGAIAAGERLDALICCGERALSIIEGYTSSGGKSAQYYPGKRELIAALPGLISKDDTVLVKASHGMHFEELLPVLEGLFIS